MPSHRPGPAEGPDPADGPRGALEFDVAPARRVALVGLGLALLGFAVVGPPLSAPGAAVCVVGLLAELCVRLAAGGVGVGARHVRGTVTEGEPLALEIVVGGSRLLGLGGPRLDHPLLSGRRPLGEVSSPPTRAPGGQRRRLLGRRSRLVQVSARTRRRGLMVLAPPRLELSDPLGLAHATASAGGEVGELLVLPRTEPVPWLAEDTSGASVYAASVVAGQEATDITGLRAYQLGTPASRIHWPALARGGDLLERVFASETQMAPLVVIDPRTGQTWSGLELLDVAIRAAASLSLALARAGAVDLLLPGHSTPVRLGPSLTSWPSVHRALALIVEQPTAAAAPPVPRGGQGALFYACSDPALVAEAAHRWSGRLWTVTPRLPGALPPPGTSELAGCVVVPHAGGA